MTATAASGKPVLVIDTAAARCQCAVMRADGWAYAAVEDRERGHAEMLLGQIEDLLDTAKTGFAGLGRVAVTTGPGSFTGVRVGLSAARGFGLALDVPVLGIPSLLALSLPAPPDRAVTVIADARRGEAYVQRFAGPALPAGPPALLPFAEALAELGPDDAVLGSAAAQAAAETGAEDLEATRTSGDRGFVDIELLALFAFDADPAGFPPDPVYLRRPDAKPQTAGRVARRRPQREPQEEPRE